MRSAHVLLAAPAIVHMSDYYYHANTLTGLLGSLYAGLDIISREQVGFVPSVSRNASLERAALGQSVTYPIAPPAVGVDIAPAMQIPEPSDQSIGAGTVTITKARAYPFGFVGEEQLGLNNGAGFSAVQADMFAQGLRGITNEMEADLAAAVAAGASRAYGTAGTTPFATDLSGTAQVRKILTDNGAPLVDLSLVIDSTAGANLRTLEKLTKVNEAGTDMTLRQGELLNVHGFSIKESAGIRTHVKGTAASATTSAAGFPVGTTTIALAAAGTGTFVAGDVISFAGDANKYLVTSGDTDASNGGNITIAAPGLQVAIPAAATAITVTNSYTPNAAFARSAVQLVMRAPASPIEGDSRLDSMMLTDPRSGLVFEVSVWPGYRKVRFEVAGVWGQKVVKPEHVTLLLG